MEKKKVDEMEKQTIIFAVETESGVLNRIGKTYIAIPKIRFQGGEVSWLADKFKTSVHRKES